MKVQLPGSVAIDTEVDLGTANGVYGLAARLKVSLPASIGRSRSSSSPLHTKRVPIRAPPRKYPGRYSDRRISALKRSAASIVTGRIHRQHRRRAARVSGLGGTGGRVAGTELRDAGTYFAIRAAHVACLVVDMELLAGPGVICRRCPPSTPRRP